MTKYLYGASVQGIQDFIFKTNRLKDIVGASEIVEEISTNFSTDFEKNCEVIQKAAGNIKLLFDNEEDVKNIVLNFPKKVMQKAYGITISQAVVKVDNELSKYDLDELEDKLKEARNKPTIPLDSSINIIKISPTTGKSAYSYDKNKKEFLDYATYIKRNNKANKLISKITDDKDIEFPKELSHISNAKNKIAIIHADGNGLGKLLQNLGKRLKQSDIKDVFSSFSTSLDDATTNAAKNAFAKVIQNDKKPKFRPLILGGDDLSVICSADIALRFTNEFLKEFEVQTKKELKSLVDNYDLGEFKEGLTACAGVAFCNEKYPFHYAINLAEDLCKEAKKEAKKINDTLAPSCLMFHNVQSSFYTSYSDFVKNELEFNNISFKFAPYYTNKKFGSTVEDFINIVNCFSIDSLPKSRLRKWLGELHYDINYASSLLKRINQVLDSNIKQATNNALKELHKDLSLDNLFITKDSKDCTPIHDIVEIASITGDKQCKFI
jgi:ribosomal protein L13